jgi:hypothetical protein
MKYDKVVLSLTALTLFSASNSLQASTSKQEQAPIREDCSQVAVSNAPRYRIVRQSRGDAKPTLFLWVSVQEKAINRSSLVALVCSLALKYSNESALAAWIFTNPKAAKDYDPTHEGNKAATERSLLATYGFSRDDASHSLDWYPDTNNRSVKVHIDFVMPPRPAPDSLTPAGGRHVKR